MKKKIISALATVGIAGTVMVGSTGAAVATAEPAEAYTITDCMVVSGEPYFADSYQCHFNYNWWEILTTGKTDGWEVMYTW